MKLLNQIQDILNSAKLKPIELAGNYKNFYIQTKEIGLVPELIPDITALELGKKYFNNIEPGHYGFSFGKPMPKVWVSLIDQILELLIQHDSDLSIAQIKIKFGGIRFYVSSKKITDIFDIQLLIERTLHDNKMIY